MDNKFSFVGQSVVPTDEADTVRILTYNVGVVNHSYHYAKLFGRKGQIAEMKLAVADSVSMLRMLCEQEGWNFDDVIVMGEEHYLEQQQIIRSRRLEDKFRETK
jgi:hypothetical protein